MRAAVFLLFALIAVTVAGQTPARSPSAPSSPTSGTASPAPGRPATAPAAAKDLSTAVIRGRVVRADNGQPLAGARVVSSNAANLTEQVSTIADDEGRFELTRLPAGPRLVVASMSGFVILAFAQRGNDSGVTLNLAAGQVLSGIDFALPKGGVISGIVLDESGAPLRGSPVRLFSRRYVNGERKLVQVRVGSAGRGDVNGAADMTDGLGRFRLFGLMAGTYYLAAGLSSAEPRSSSSVSESDFYRQPTFYPGTLSSAPAKPIEIAVGAEVTGLSFAILPAKLATIRGEVHASDGALVQPQTFSVTASDEFGRPRGGRTSGNGTFDVRDLAPGQYTIFARAFDEIALVRVTLDGGDLFVPLTLKPGRQAGGHLVFEGGPPPPNDPRLRVSFQAADTSFQSTGTVIPEADWTFGVVGLVPGPHHVSVATPAGWTMKSIQRSGFDIADLPIDLTNGDVEDIEITLTRRITSVTGRVTNARGEPTAASVVVFSEDAGKWRPRSRFVRGARADQNGRFTIIGLPPARYFVATIEGLDVTEGTSPEVLEELTRVATRMTLGEGETRTLDLRVAPGP